MILKIGDQTSSKIDRVVMLPLMASNGHMGTTVDCDAASCDDQVSGVWRGRTVER